MSRPYDSVLTLENLAAGYQGRLLFRNLSLRLKGGELVCFMGPNGSGKSTLIRTIAGLQVPLEGKVHFCGQSIGIENTRKIISLVLTDPIKAAYMNVFELVSFGRYPYVGWQAKLSSIDLQIIDTALKQVNIYDLKHRLLNELSDGQRQMAMIARAIAQQTPVLLLDEPTAHLDLNNRVEIMRLLRNLCHETGRIVLLATHELDLALQTADKIWLAGDNEIFTGVPEELVLSGAFDDIFKFKGFDLKTGRVQHESFRSHKVRVVGEGHYYLWTKNLFERNGFEVTASDEALEVRIEVRGQKLYWIINSDHEFASMTPMLQYVESLL